jgi:hypothetical protein
MKKLLCMSIVFAFWAVYKSGGMRPIFSQETRANEIINSIEADEDARVIRFALKTGPGAKIYEARY